MLDDHNRIAQLLQLAQHFDEQMRVARMEPDAGLVEDIERTHQTAAQRRGQVDALALTAREGRRQPVEREVVEPHLLQKAYTISNLGQQSLGDGRVVLVELQFVEEGFQFADGQIHQLGNGAAPHLHIFGFGFQTAALAHRAGSLAPVAGEHHPVLYLVLVGFEHGKETVDSFEVAGSVPQNIFLAVGELIVGAMYGEMQRLGPTNECVFPLAHLLTPPAHHGVVVDREGLVGHHQILVDADDPSESLALGAGPHGVVEVEHQVARLVEGDAVGLESFRKIKLLHSLGRVHLNGTLAIPLEEGGLDRIGQPADGVVLVRHAQPVDNQAHLRSFGQSITSQQFFNRHKAAVYLDPGESLLLQDLQLSLQVTTFGQRQVGEQGKACTVGEPEGTVYHVVHLVFLDQGPRYGRIGLPDTGIEHAQVVVDFGRGTHRRPRIARVDLLLDGYGRRYALDVVALGFAHTPQELPGIGRQALDVAALPLGIECIEGQ